MPILSGNPILSGIGLCDPHVRIYNDRAYLYATHDRSPDNRNFIMEDWWYFICNEMGITQNSHFRDSSLCHVNYRANGEMIPVTITLDGVSSDRGVSANFNNDKGGTNEQEEHMHDLRIYHRAVAVPVGRVPDN